MKKGSLIRIASTICWVWGILMAISAVAIGMSMISKSGNLFFSLALGLMGILFCLAGHGIRRHRRYSHWLAVFSCIVTSALLLMVRFPISPVGLVVCMAIVMLVLINWKTFEC